MNIFFKAAPIEGTTNAFGKLIDYFSENNIDYFYYRCNRDSYSFIAYQFEEYIDADTRNYVDVLANIKASLQDYLTGLPRDILSSFPAMLSFIPFDDTKSESWSDFSKHLVIPKTIIVSIRDMLFLIERIGSDNFPSEAENIKAIFIDNLAHKCSKMPRSENLVSDNLQHRKQESINNIGLAIEQILNGQIEKVVLARKIDLKISGEPAWSVVKQEMDNYINSHRFIIRQNGSTFFGTSPEILFSYRSGKIFSEALAGTIERSLANSDDMQAAVLGNSKKDGVEQSIVVEHIISVLSKYSDSVVYDKQARIRVTNKLLHLRTRILARHVNKKQLGAIFAELFPTPAVCGQPKEKARELLRQLEEYERGLYSGAIGWTSPDGGMLYFVPLRCALYKAKTLSIFAGSGIVADSEPNTEFTETVVKAGSVAALVFDEN